MVQEHDEPVLKKLTDIKIKYDDEVDDIQYIIYSLTKHIFLAFLYIGILF